MLLTSILSGMILGSVQNAKMDEIAVKFLRDLPAEMSFVRKFRFEGREPWKVVLGDPKAGPPVVERWYDRFSFFAKDQYGVVVQTIKTNLTPRFGWELNSEGGGFENFRARRKRPNGDVDYIVDLYSRKGSGTGRLFMYDESNPVPKAVPPMPREARNHNSKTIDVWSN